MSRLEELIKEKCPNGVKYKKLYEITNWDKRFNGVSQDMQTNILSYKHVSAELLKSLLQDNGNIKLLSTGLFDGYTTEELANDLVNEGEVISIPSGGAANIKYYNGKFVDSGNNLASSRDDELYNLKYIFYVLQSKNNVVSDYFRGSGVKHPSMPDILKIDIPIPPIEVQEEIVRILDKFGKLEAELEAELEARKSQYEFWCKKLLNKQVNNKISACFTRLKGTLITASKMKKIETRNGEIRIFAGGQTKVDTSRNYIPETDIINVPCVIVQSRGLIDFIYYDRPCSFKKEMWAYTCDNPITVRYLYYYLKQHINYFRTIGSQMGSMPQISLSVTEDFQIYLPDIKKQQRIVNILDKFDKLVNDISEGLPAEIELRKQQYEYYRNKLLSFEELKNE